MSGNFSAKPPSNAALGIYNVARDPKQRRSVTDIVLLPEQDVLERFSHRKKQNKFVPETLIYFWDLGEGRLLETGRLFYFSNTKRVLHIVT